MSIQTDEFAPGPASARGAGTAARVVSGAAGSPNEEAICLLYTSDAADEL